MLTDCLYQASATASGGREGQAATSDGSLHAWLDLPAELGGRGHGNNPEQLFAAGYAACFLSTLKTLKNQGNVAVPANATVTATVGLGPRADGGFGLAITLRGAARRGSKSRPGVDGGRPRRLSVQPGDRGQCSCPSFAGMIGSIGQSPRR
jgi:Ohr subfamily peroxiredoxin